MPQMAPMMWLNLMMMFVTIFLMFNLMNFFILLKENKLTFKKSLIKNSLNWKW